MTISNTEKTQIKIPDLCRNHLARLVRGARYSESDPWRALTIAAQIALFQAATADEAIQMRCGGDATEIGELGCLACLKPDAFAQIVVIARKSKDLTGIKELGESWVHAARGN